MMRLRRLDLDRFGHFTGRSLDFGPLHPAKPDFHIIHGRNEAGKTTLMEGYLRLLFGFDHIEDYAFLHPANTLQVSGVLETGDRVIDVVRTKGRKSTLHSRGGDPLPDSTIAGLLGGLTRQSYRSMLSLDDQSIEDGGEAILRSQGDIGAMLFSAAAGLEGVAGVLRQMEEQAAAAYAKKASKTTYAQLKAELEQVRDQERAVDVSAGRYKQMRRNLQVAQQLEADLRTRRAVLERQRARLTALADAHPLASELVGVEARLEPLRHLPDPAGIEPEDLVRLATQRAALQAERTGHAERADALRDEADRLLLRPDLIALKPRLESLEDLSKRASTGEADIPRRRGELHNVLQAMRDQLADAGIVSDGDPRVWLIPELHLARLAALQSDLERAERDASAATRELNDAIRLADEANAELANAKASVSVGPDIGATLARHDGENVLRRLTETQLALAAARRAHERSVSVLAAFGASLPGTSGGSVSPAQAKRLALELEGARDEASRANEKRTECATRHVVALSRVTALRSAHGVHTAQESDDLRAERDRLWSVHRRTLDAASAETFEVAMRRDDESVRRLVTEAAAVAELRQAVIAEAEAAAALDQADKVSKVQAQRLAEAGAAWSVMLGATGLPAGFDPADMPAWLAACDEARRMAAELDDAKAAAAPAAEAGMKLVGELAALPELSGHGDDLAALLARAQKLHRLHLEQVAAQSVAADAVLRANAALDARRNQQAEAAGRLEQAWALWKSAISECLPPEAPDAASMRHALPTLSRLRQDGERARGVERQIASMNADVNEFADSLSGLAAQAGVGLLARPADTWKAVEVAVAAAIDAAARREDLIGRAADADDRRIRCDEELAAIDARVRTIASLLGSLESPTIDVLRSDVDQARQARHLRAERVRLSEALCRRLGVADRAKAMTALAECPEMEVPGRLAEVEADLAALQATFEAATADRLKAEQELNSVSGSDDIARLSARRRTLENQIEDVLFEHLRTRLGLHLANRALARYRDAHRSGMLKATEQAFAMLTDGAYSTLTTRTDGNAETLLALETRDGRAREARHMSKGTRFQLYLALRVAAYEQMAAHSGPLPFFCDDIFETFDEVRTTAACRLMHRIGQTGQAIYLTHHRHVVDIASSLFPGEVKVHQLSE